MLARDPLSVVVITSKVAAESFVDAAVVAHFTVQYERKRTALSWNGRGVVAFIKTTLYLTLYSTKAIHCATLNNGNGNENISNAPPTVDRRRIT